MSESAIRLENVTRRFGEVVAVDTMNLDIQDGEFFSLLGPSGCGKTTTLRMIAGFDQPDSGTVSIYGKPMGITPPFRRPVNTVFQNYALFPHMTVFQNIAFGLQMKGVESELIKERVAETMEMMRLAGLDNRRTDQLSGGQQQRVALARAIINRPEVLLLDEPLGALDLKLRQEMQLELKSLQARLGITFIYVTHDQEEALTMSDRIAVMNFGKILQLGAPREVYEQPANRFVADFIGETNFLEGMIDETDGDFARVTLAGGAKVNGATSDDFSANQTVTVSIRPERVNIIPISSDRQKEYGAMMQNLGMISQAGNLHELAQMTSRKLSSDVLVPATIQEIIYIGTDTRYVVQLPGEQQLVVRAQNFDLRFSEMFKQKEEVLVYWTAPNARVLKS